MWYFHFYTWQINKGDIWLQFENNEKIRQVALSYRKSKTNTKKLISPLLTRPKGCQGCLKMPQDLLNMPYEVWCAKIAPKRHKLQKSSKLNKNCQKKPCFLRHFRIFFNLGPILAHQTSYGMFSRSWDIFRHPWHTVLPNRFYADILTIQNWFFQNPKTTPRGIPIYPVMISNRWGPNQRPKSSNWYVIELMRFAHLYIPVWGKETTLNTYKLAFMATDRTPRLNLTQWCSYFYFYFHSWQLFQGHIK